MIKQYLKNSIGWLKCKLNHVTYASIPYIGMGVKIINKGGVALGRNVIIRPSTHIWCSSKDSQILLGNSVEIGNHSTISSHHSIEIKDGVLTGPHVFIADHNHNYLDISKWITLQGVSQKDGDRVLIEEGTWLGTNVVVVGNVHIGKQCVIGANSVVVRDVPDYSVAVGIPAKVVKRYNLETKKWEKV
jgi:acetyltransferase-like isoleucine patch superfamily enzyme